MTIEFARNGNVEIAYETIGPRSGDPLLMVPGTGGGILDWDPDFCQALIDSGFHVFRFDNRDSGRSTHLTEAGTPNQLKMWLRPSSEAVYRLEDMAGDAVAILDAIGWESAHVMGVSLGGALAQVMATEYPERVRSLTSISANPAPRIGAVFSMRLLRIAKVMKRPVTTLEGHVEQQIEFNRVVGSPLYPTDIERIRTVARELNQRGFDLPAIQRQGAAASASGDRRRALSKVTAPTLVIHGEEDQMMRPIAAEETAKAIPEAKLVVYPGMAHDLPRQLWPSIIGEIRDLVERAGNSSHETDQSVC